MEKTRYHNQTCFRAIKFGKKAVLLCHKNLTVKIVLPLQDYKAQYSVIIFISYISSLLLPFLFFFFIEDSSCLVPLHSIPRFPLWCAGNILVKLSSFISMYTNNTFLKGKEQLMTIYCLGAETSSLLAVHTPGNQSDNGWGRGGPQS